MKKPNGRLFGIRQTARIARRHSPKLLLSVFFVTAAAVAYFAAPSPASASPITYEFVGASAYFSDPVDATFNITGAFTYDASLTSPLIDASITLSGPGTLIPGLYNIPDNQPQFSKSEILIKESANTGTSIHFYFFDPLGSGPDLLAIAGTSTISFPDSPYSNCGPCSPITGEVDPTPLPAALPLFASGLGAMGLLGCRRKRKAAAAIAAA